MMKRRRGGEEGEGAWWTEERGETDLGREGRFFLHRLTQRMLGPRLGPMICTYVEDCLWRSRQLFNLIARCYVGTVSFPI